MPLQELGISTLREKGETAPLYPPWTILEALLYELVMPT
jgi:hypothetical protein